MSALDLLVSVGVPVATLLAGALIGSIATTRRERSRWLRNEVYRPLYNEASRLIESEGRIEDAGFTSLGESLDPFARARIKDAELLAQLVVYASAVKDSLAATAEESRLRNKPPAALLKAISDAIPVELRLCSDSTGGHNK